MRRVILSDVVITKSIKLSASHILFEQNGKCSRLHGHNYDMTIELMGTVDPKSLMVMDYALVGSILEAFKTGYDHLTWVPLSRVRPDPHNKDNLMFTVEVTSRGEKVTKKYSLPYRDCMLVSSDETTAESICDEFLRYWLRQALPSNVWVHAAVVKETDGTSARIEVSKPHEFPLDRMDDPMGMGEHNNPRLVILE